MLEIVLKSGERTECSFDCIYCERDKITEPVGQLSLYSKNKHENDPIHEIHQSRICKIVRNETYKFMASPCNNIFEDITRLNHNTIFENILFKINY